MVDNKQNDSLHKGTPDALKSDRAQNKAETIKFKKEEIQGSTALALKDLKKSIFAPTLEARNSDLPSVRYGRFLEKFEGELKKYESVYLKKFDDLLDSKLTDKQLFDEMDRLNREYKTKALGLKRAIEYAIKALAGTNRQLEKKDFAYLYSLLDNISNLYSKDNKIADMMTHIYHGNLNRKEWDTVCGYIKQYDFKEKVTGAGDEIKQNVTAMLIRIMDQNQRYKLVIEFSKRYSNAEAAKLAEGMVSANLLNLKQYEVLMKEFNGKNFKLSAAKEEEIKKQQAIMMRINQGVEKNIKKAMFVQGRILNRYSVASLGLTLIGTLGMVANYMTHFNKNKGFKKYLAGFKSPYFWLSAVGAGAGVHFLGKGMTAGSHGVGLLDKIIAKPKPMTNPFEGTSNADLKLAKFNELSDICSNHRLLERWLLYNNGFDDIQKFYAKKRFNIHRLRTSVKEKGRRPGEKEPKKRLVVEFIEFQKAEGNKLGAKMIEQAVGTYGADAVEMYIYRLTVISSTLGITSSRMFRKQSVHGRMFTHHELLLHTQGIKGIPRARLPEAQAAAAKAKAEAKAKAKAAAAKKATPKTKTT